MDDKASADRRPLLPPEHTRLMMGLRQARTAIDAAMQEIAAPSGGRDPVAQENVDLDRLRRIRDARRARAQYFADGLFEDPAWDMIIDLYIAHLEGRQVSVSSLSIASEVAPTTALRWIAKLTEIGLLTRQPDPDDRRRAFMVLTDGALRGMQSYLGSQEFRAAFD